MNTEKLYRNCHSTYDKWKRAGEAIEMTNDTQVELAERMFMVNIVMLGVMISMVIITMLFTQWFAIGAIITGLIWMNKVEKYNNDIDTLQRLYFQLIYEQSAFATIVLQEAETTNNPFKDCVSVTDVKKVYREHAKKHHPDRGGDSETFSKLTNQYQKALASAKA